MGEASSRCPGRSEAQPSEVEESRVFQPDGAQPSAAEGCDGIPQGSVQKLRSLHSTLQDSAAALAWLEPVTVVAGHYGVGKTNLAVNLALDAAAAGAEVVLVDLDIVNPYFRSSDYTDLLESRGVRVVAPVLAGTSLDSPSLSGRVGTAIEWAQGAPEGASREPDAVEPVADVEAAGVGTRVPERAVIIDVGGDDVGATALGRFSELVARAPYALIYVVNRYRNLTPSPEDALVVLREIEQKSGLRATAVANNSHLKQETSVEVVEAALDFGRQVAALAGVPLAFATASKSLACGENQGVFSFAEQQNVYPVSVFVKTPWE